MIIGYSNDHLSRDWQLNHGKHLMMEKVIQEGIFDNVSEDAIIYLPNYNQTVSKLGRNTTYTTHPYFWASYIYHKVNGRQNIHYGYESFKNSVEADPDKDVYYITKYETSKSFDVLLVLSKVNLNSIDFENEETLFSSATANVATVYYYSSNKNFIFQFVIPDYSSGSTIIINNETLHASRGINAINIENENRTKAITSFKLESDDPFSVKEFAISNLGLFNDKKVYLYY
jgi:hypothetical protein